MLKFNIEPSSPIPVYQQVKQTLILEMMSQRLKEGDSLPSIRSLAKILKVTPGTIAKVYYSLDEEGFIQGKRGSGYTVKCLKSKKDNLKQSIIEEELKAVLEKAFSLGFNKDTIKDLISRLLTDS